RVCGEQAHRRTQVGELALAVLVRAPTAAGPEAAVVEGERGQAALVQPRGVDADDLLLDAGERSGQHDGRRTVRRHGEVADQRDTVDRERDPLGVHAAASASSAAIESAPRPIIQDSGAPGRNRVITAVNSSRCGSVRLGAPAASRRTVSRYIMRYRRWSASMPTSPGVP